MHDHGLGLAFQEVIYLVVCSGLVTTQGLWPVRVGGSNGSSWKPAEDLGSLSKDGALTMGG